MELTIYSLLSLLIRSKEVVEKLANISIELIKWCVGTIIAATGVVAAIVKLIG